MGRSLNQDLQESHWGWIEVTFTEPSLLLSLSLCLALIYDRVLPRRNRGLPDVRRWPGSDAMAVINRPRFLSLVGRGAFRLSDLFFFSFTRFQGDLPERFKDVGKHVTDYVLC